MAIWLKDLLRAAVAILIMGIAPVVAGDWSDNIVLGHTSAFNDNPSLAVHSNGYVFTESEQFTNDLIYTMPDGKFDILGSLTRNDYFGPGAGTARDVFLPSIQAHLNKFGPRTTFDLTARYAFEQVPFLDNSIYDNCTPIPGTVLLDCDGVITDPVPNFSNGTKHSLSSQAVLTYALDERDSLTWTNSLGRKLYTKNAGSTATTYSSQLGFDRKLTKRNDGNFSLGFDWLDVNNPARLDRYVLSAKGKVTSHLTNRVTMHTGAGLSWINLALDDVALPGTPRSTRASWTANANLGFDYLLNETTSLSINEYVTAVQQTNNKFLNRYTTSMDMSHQISERSSLDVTSGVTFAEAIGAKGKETIFSFNVSPSYSLKLTPHWTLGAAYKFALRKSSAGTATSNNVNVSLTKDFVANP